jgi:F-type H+-transporting ATPase subunit c
MVELMVNVMTAASLAAEETAASAQGGVGGAWGVIGVFGAVIAAGIVVFGAALGIGRLASAAMDAIARQPEAGGRLFTTMLLSAAFIEGVALFGLLVCFLAMWRLS